VSKSAAWIFLPWQISKHLKIKHIRDWYIWPHHFRGHYLPLTHLQPPFPFLCPLCSQPHFPTQLTFLPSRRREQVPPKMLVHLLLDYTSILGYVSNRLHIITYKTTVIIHTHCNEDVRSHRQTLSNESINLLRVKMFPMFSYAMWRMNYLKWSVTQWIFNIFQFLRRDSWVFFRSSLHNSPPDTKPNQTYCSCKENVWQIS
jgi:hypothetical protein